jgi:hypothetical protein
MSATKEVPIKVLMWEKNNRLNHGRIEVPLEIRTWLDYTERTLNL